MNKQDFQDLKERLAEFAKKAAKEAHDDENIQKLAEGCIWIGAVWLARACNINIGVDLHHGICINCEEESDEITADGRCVDCVEEESFTEQCMKGGKK